MEKVIFVITLLAITIVAQEISETSTFDQDSEISIANQLELNNNSLLVNTSIVEADEPIVDKSDSEPHINKTHKFVQCITGAGTSAVQLANDTELIKLLQPDPKVTDREVPGLCLIVLFYSKYCPFSSLAAPHFNAFPKVFPDLKMVAINAMIYHLFNTQNGIVGVPSLVLFHNGKSVAKFNGSEYSLELFSQFITKHTGIAAAEKSFVTSADFAGPVVSVPSKDIDMFLLISWLFILVCSGYYFTRSRWWKWIIEMVQSNWRESEAQAQHEHID